MEKPRSLPAPPKVLSHTLFPKLSVFTRYTSRSPAPEEKRQDAVQRAREVGDLVDRMAEYLFLACACGVRIKVPPDFKHDTIKCPRCGREHAIPAAELAAVAAIGAGVAGGRAGAEGATVPPPPPMRYQRKSTGWESFRCRCGHTIQLSPSFGAEAVRCPKCGQRIEVLGNQ